jgi:hypothetical protein
MFKELTGNTDPSEAGVNNLRILPATQSFEDLSCFA